MEYKEDTDHNHTCVVHQAVLRNSLSKLKVLVEENNDNLRCTNSLGQTPLLTGIIKNRSENVILFLIEAGSDVNALDCWGRNSLHTAIEHRLDHKIIHELLKKGVNVDAQDMNGRTPMHHAVLHGTDLLAMLLYYNADVTIESAEGYTAISNAIGWCNFEAVELLIDYYSNEDLSTVLNNYFYVESNWIGLQFILKLKYSKLFKTFWSVIDISYLAQTLPCFILIFLNECNFSKQEWIEALLIILTSEIAGELVSHISKETEGYNFESLFCALHNNEIDSENRVIIINLFLSLGAQVYYNDIRDVLNIYSCGREFECLIYTVNKSFNTILHPLSYYLVNLKTDYSAQCLLNLFKMQIRSVLCTGLRTLQDSVIRNMGFFSLPLFVKTILLEECEHARFNRDQVVERFSTLPEFPTLLELSRNQVRNHIVQFYKVRYAYGVIDVVKRLAIPQVIKDIILFRANIY
ncbi:hypothetical protein RN001_011088 [Aquatica leii]|uniref:Uncharacterized protein n=1 Tax=Aquatica leii TaxID=1421715 RepID=A0AAN7SEV0_9COLE|nr:hypothetical protein RN001_011088 [Aquatica leii]